MDISENFRIGQLLDVYGKLLSDKQLEILSASINHDMSLAEIAENNNISRPAVVDAIKTAKTKLENFESVLNVCQFKTKILKALEKENIKDEITKILEEF